ncbi:hypothetical protein GCM10020358_61390 [Amorphoplanes nipponensis]|uniref:HTH marR-type domain-containing protein n=1 Tax=Actinoplanes nipponensis TaxID=135950 RepID=A0A919JR53_9ACTN|nr:MarR family transcriptional regulator [Actinoplanes nipponensis]GIE53942.1 hypothetical protein Ani05nite_74760 [Actinoplanes nipponensis]
MTGQRRAPRHSELAYAVRDMLRANGEAVQSVARRLALGLTDVTALDHVVTSADGLGPSELGQRLGIRSASATTLVDRLESTGHVRRVAHPSDRRRQSVVATDRAYEEVFAALAPLLGRIDEAAGQLTPEQAAATARFLHDVAGAMRDYAAER